MVNIRTLSDFLIEAQRIINYYSSLCFNFLRTIYGTSLSIDLGNLLFIIAALPVFLSLGVEILFTFILSFRFRRFTPFVPWRRSSYSALRNSYHNSYIPIFNKRRGNYKYIHSVDHVRFYSFAKRPINDADYKSVNVPVTRGSHYLRPFRSKLGLVVKDYKTGRKT